MVEVHEEELLRPRVAGVADDRVDVGSPYRDLAGDDRRSKGPQPVGPRHDGRDAADFRR
jgi:hypothetical protein